MKTISLIALFAMLAVIAVQAADTAQSNAAVTEAPELVPFDRPEDTERYMHLLKQLRCLVCQNQTLADSAAGLAKDLRDEVEKRVRQGEPDQQIIDFMVERYGDFVLYNPPLKKSTVLLWFSPFIFAGIAAVALIWFLLQRNEKKSDARLGEARRKRAAALLAASKDKDDNDEDASKS